MKEIQLTRGYVALVDDEDFEWLNSFKWSVNISKKGYLRAKRGPTKDCKYEKMSRMILGITDPKIIVDHKDRNALNNQRNNLRVATKNDNCSNVTKANGRQSKYLGVYKHTFGKWHACIKKHGKKYSLGYYKTEEEAAIAYNKKALELHGQFANLNKV